MSTEIGFVVCLTILIVSWAVFLWSLKHDDNRIETMSPCPVCREAHELQNCDKAQEMIQGA